MMLQGMVLNQVIHDVQPPSTEQCSLNTVLILRLGKEFQQVAAVNPRRRHMITTCYNLDYSCAYENIHFMARERGLYKV